MKNIKEIMKECLTSEAESLRYLSESIEQNSVSFCEVISKCSSKVIFTGVGKSLIVASKIAGTLSSIGIASTAISPLSLLHGDLGFITSDDLVIALSNSGETDILIDALDCIKSKGAKILSITGNARSTIAGLSSETIEIPSKEVGPFGLVPTTSTTLMMAFGDAIACALVEIMNIDINDFYANHPFGSLSKK